MRLDKIMKMARSQGGFTIVEVLIATLLLTMSSLGILGVFNSSTQLSMIARETKEAQQYARTVSETVRALPFYVPYDGTDADVDDFFWGTAEDHGGSMTNNFWGDEGSVLNPQNLSNPFIPCTLVTHERFTAEIKMAYVLDDLSTSPMKEGWIPKATPDQTRKDEPRNVDVKEFKIIQYEVKVTWKSKLQGSTKTHKYSYTSLMTNTEFEANLGVTSVTNVDGNSSKWGTGGEDSNTVPHDVSSVAIEIKGYGFKSDTVPLLMRSGCVDKAFQNVVVVNDQTITCLLSPDTGGLGKPWSSKLNPGEWTVRVKTGFAYAYGYNAFIVEFPRPVITTLSPSPARGPISSTNFSITAGGNKVLNLGGTPSYCGATIRLVKVGSPTSIIDPIAGETITYMSPVPADKGYTSYNYVTAKFKLTGRETGFYHVEIVNCENNAGPPEAAGNTTSLPNDSFKFEIYTVSPIPNNMYIIGSSGGEIEEATALNQMRHFAYRARNYTYRIRVEGSELSAVTTLKIGINGDPATGTSGLGEVFDATITATTQNTIDATVDFNSVSSSLARDDGTYSWWIYCAYNTGQSGYAEHSFQIRNPRPILYKDAEYVSGPGGFYHNYHSVTAKLTGECFDTTTGDTSPRVVKYLSGDYGTGFINNVEYTVGISDGTMLPSTPTANGTRWQPQLNLIHCRNTANNIWVTKTDGTTDNNKSGTTLDPGNYKFNVTVVVAPTPVLRGGQETGSVSIVSWYNYVGIQGPRTETEDASNNARAQRTNSPWFQPQRQGYAQFKLQGQGFKDAVVGTSNIKVYAWVPVWWWWEWSQIGNGDFSVPNPENISSANTDRVAKYVTISSNAYPSAWQMSDGDYNGRILITNTGSSDYPDRFLIRQIF